MPDLPWLEKYSGESIDKLVALEGKYRIDSLVSALEQAIDQKAARVGEERLAEEEQTVLIIAALEREVNNGGYGQFFANSSRLYATKVVDALRAIGCPKTAAITQQAIDAVQRFPITPDEIKNGSWVENDERWELLNECDELFFDRSENIELSLFAFIKANRKKITPDG